MIFRQIDEIIHQTKGQTRRVYKPGEYAVDKDGQIVIDPGGQRVSDQPIRVVYTPGGRVKWRVLGFYAVSFKRGKPQEMWDRKTLQHITYPDNCPMSVEEWRDKCQVAGWFPLSIRIAQIRLERLLDITEDDARAEGVEQVNTAPWTTGSLEDTWLGSYRLPYIRLWESINGRGSWDKNPLVWPITFGVVKSRTFTTVGHVTYYAEDGMALP